MPQTMKIFMMILQKKYRKSAGNQQHILNSCALEFMFHVLIN